MLTEQEVGYGATVRRYERDIYAQKGEMSVRGGVTAIVILLIIGILLSRFLYRRILAIKSLYSVRPLQGPRKVHKEKEKEKERE